MILNLLWYWGFSIEIQNIQKFDDDFFQKILAKIADQVPKG